jgi:hypothetical protein
MGQRDSGTKSRGTGTLIANFRKEMLVNGFRSINSNKGRNLMNNLLRGGLAGAAAYKLGGGIVSTILIFILVFWLLGKC